MLATLAMIRREYGSIEAYVHNECGLSPEDTKQLRANLTVDVAEGHRVVDWVSHAKYLL